MTQQPGPSAELGKAGMEAWIRAYFDECKSGDLILSGTPANSRSVKPSDVVAFGVEGLGRLENFIVERARLVSREYSAQPTNSDKASGVAIGEGLRE